MHICESQLFIINYHSKKTYFLNYSSYYYIINYMNQIELLDKIPVKNQIFIFAGRQLDHNRDLGSQNI